MAPTPDESLAVLLLPGPLEGFERECGCHAGETSADGKFTVRAIECLGGCGWATIVAIDEHYRTHVQPDDVPSIVEAGYPRAEYVFWNGLAVPAKTPRSITDILHEQIEKTLQDPAIQEKLKQLGVQPELMSSAQFDKFAKDDFAATAQLAKDAHIEPTD